MAYSKVSYQFGDIKNIWLKVNRSQIFWKLIKDLNDQNHTDTFF